MSTDENSCFALYHTLMKKTELMQRLCKGHMSNRLTQALKAYSNGQDALTNLDLIFLVPSQESSYIICACLVLLC